MSVITGETKAEDMDEALCYEPEDRGFGFHNQSSRTRALGSTQHLTQMSVRNLSVR
jgi:hypothetical protein